MLQDDKFIEHFEALFLIYIFVVDDQLQHLAHSVNGTTMEHERRVNT